MAIIDKPDLHFETKLYTGTGATQSITSLDFAPDMVWIKGRSGATEHVWTDSVRGVTKELSSNDDGAEETVAQGLTAFGSGGFTVGTDGSYNTSSATYASWNFKAGGTAVSNTAGSITSSVSANTDSGFSIVSYTGNGIAGATIGHGLGVAPAMIIQKIKSSTGNWLVYHNKNTSAPETEFLRLNLTNATADELTIWNDTAPDSDKFTVGTESTINGSGATFVAYCFANTSMIKAGSYTGNGSTDGTFVFTGMKPAFVITKRTDSADDWGLLDNKRDGYNLTNKALTPNSSGAEYTTNSPAGDFVANGFKIRQSDGVINASGGTYIYLAIAEQPFVTSTTNGSIPATAR